VHRDGRHLQLGHPSANVGHAVLHEEVRAGFDERIPVRAVSRDANVREEFWQILQSLQRLHDGKDERVDEALERALYILDSDDDGEVQEDGEFGSLRRLKLPDRHLSIDAKIAWEEDYDSGGEKRAMLAELNLFLSKENLENLTKEFQKYQDEDGHCAQLCMNVDTEISVEWVETNKEGTRYKMHHDLVPEIMERMPRFTSDVEMTDAHKLYFVGDEDDEESEEADE
jgi:hypothetical protein